MATPDLEKIPLTTLRLMIPYIWDVNQDSCEWAILDRQAKILRRGKDLLNELPQCDEVEIVVSASIVGFIPAQLPSGNQSKVLNSLVFLVEAGLISAPEDTHAVLAEQSSNQIVVAVIQKAWVKQLLEKLSRADIFPVRMFPETLLPTLPQDGWSMVCRGRDSFLRTSNNKGVPIDINSDNDSPPFLLTVALQQTETSNRPQCIAIYGEPATYADSWESQLGISLIRPPIQEWFLSHSKPSVNLLQGEFQPSGGVARSLIAFKPLAITLLYLIALQISLTLLDYAFKLNENLKLDRAMLTQFKATFPKANTVVDAPLQMQRNLEELKHGAGQSGNTDYIPLLASITTSIGAIPIERLRSMEYRNGKLILSLLLPDMELVQAMQQRLSISGLSATIESSRKMEQGIELQLLVSASAS